METSQKNYSIFAHAIHSRLQLVKDKLDVHQHTDTLEFVSLNKKQFDLIAETIDRYHHYKAGRTDYMNAAELFLSTINSSENKIESLPIWKPRHQER